MSDLFKKFWPDILAVLLFAADYLSKRLNDYAAGHEHSTVFVLLAAVLAAWHAQHLKPQNGALNQNFHLPAPTPASSPGPLKPPNQTQGRK